MGSFTLVLCTSINRAWPVLTLTVVFIASSAYDSLVIKVLYFKSKKIKHSIFWIGIYLYSVY